MTTQQIEQAAAPPAQAARAEQGLLPRADRAYAYDRVQEHDGSLLEQFVANRPFTTGILVGLLGAALGMVVKRIVSHNLPGKPTTPPPFDD